MTPEIQSRIDVLNARITELQTWQDSADRNGWSFMIPRARREELVGLIAERDRILADIEAQRIEAERAAKFGNWQTLPELMAKTGTVDIDKRWIPMAGVSMVSVGNIVGSKNDINATYELIKSAEEMMRQWGVPKDRISQIYEEFGDGSDPPRVRDEEFWSLPLIVETFAAKGLTLAYDHSRQKGNFYSSRSWSAQFGVLNAATGEVLYEYRVGEGSMGSAIWKGFALPVLSLVAGNYAGAVGAFVAPSASAATQAIVGNAVVSGATSALRGGDFEDVIAGAVIGAAGGVAKPYINDAIDYVAGLMPDQLADVAAVGQINYQEQVGIDLAEAQAGAIFDFNAAQAAADAAAAAEAAAAAAAQSAATLAPPPSPIVEFMGPTLPTYADEAAVAAAQSAAQSAALAQELVDPVAYPLTDSVAPTLPAEVFPLGPPKMLPVTAEDVQSVGESVTNLETDYDWLFGYTDPMADFATTDNSYLTDPAGDFFELPDLDLTGLDLTGIDAGYVPSAQDVASNVGYVEAGLFAPGAGAQDAFDRIVRNVTVAAGTALTLVRAWREIDGPPPNTTAQARVGSNVVRANPDGTITTTNAAGQVIRTLPPTGQAQMATDGSMIVNNGDGSYTRITPDGRTTVQRYGTTPAASSGIAGISTPLLIGAGALLVFAVAGGRRA